MKRNRSQHKRIALDMTSMIDVVFLLLVFFVMTFKIVIPEGDFSIKMPPAAPSQPLDVDPPEPIRIRMRANEDGTLAGMYYGDDPLGTSFRELRGRVLREVTRRGGPDKADIDIELAPADNLHYGHVMEAITAVTGQIQNGNVYRICDQVKFAPRASTIPD